jgi:hypothetical protein
MELQILREPTYPKIEKRRNAKMNKILARFLVALVIVSLCIIPMAGSNGGVQAADHTPPALTPISPSISYPTPIAPSGGTDMTRPTFQWTNVPGAQLYELTISQGYKHKYTYFVAPYNCGVSTCTFTPSKALAALKPYEWWVATYSNGSWSYWSGEADFTVYKTFNSTFNNTKGAAGWYGVYGIWGLAGGSAFSPGGVYGWSNMAHTGIYDTYTYQVNVYRSGMGSPDYWNNLYFNGDPSSIGYSGAGMWNNTYMFNWSNDGYISLWLISGGVYYSALGTTYIGWPINSSGANVVGVAYNSLTTLTGLYINYVQVALCYCGSFTHGQVGVGFAESGAADYFAVDSATLVPGAPAYLVTPPDNSSPEFVPFVIDDQNATPLGDGPSVTH